MCGGGVGSRKESARRADIYDVLTAFQEVCWTFISTLSFNPYNTNKVLSPSHFMEEEPEGPLAMSSRAGIGILA